MKHYYHFTSDTLRDGTPIPPVGETLVHEGPLVLCLRGLHASAHPFDALQYAPGPMLHRVQLGGEIKHDINKVVATERTIIASIDATDLLRRFARRCALDVIGLWDAPDIVRRYLRTGDESLRAAARDAAGDAARAAARDAAWDAARAAAGDAARAAAGDAQRRRFARMVAQSFREEERT